MLIKKKLANTMWYLKRPKNLFGLGKRKKERYYYGLKTISLIKEKHCLDLYQEITWSSKEGEIKMKINDQGLEG